jgi:chitin synthase
MHGIMKNIRHLASRNNAKTWGEDSWKKVVVCIVADGRKKCNDKVYNYLAAMGVYQEGVAKREVKGKAVEAHIYEVNVQRRVRGVYFSLSSIPSIETLLFGNHI